MLVALILILLATRVFRPDDAALAQVDSGWKRALAWAWGQWHGQPRPCLARLLLGLLVVRFMLPAVVLGSEALFQRFPQPDYVAAQQSLERSSAEVAAPPAAASAPPAAPPGVVERMRRWWGETADPMQRLEDLKTRANEAVEHVVRLIVVFKLQTLVLPLLLGWVLWRLLRAAVFGADTYRR